MVLTGHLASIASEIASDLMETQDGGELQQRLRLYQVFLKLYQHHRGLLDEILNLENSSSNVLASLSLPYVQGMILGQDTYLVTNLLQGKTQAIRQPQQTWTIGRDPRRAALPIQDTRLSRCHAVLKYVEHQGFYLIDLSSRNGSYVNGELVRQSRLLQDGDRVRLGSVTFVFFCCQSIQPLSTLPVEIQHSLNNWQPTPIVSHLKPQLDVEEVPTEGKAVSTTPLDETSMFMRVNPGITSSTSNPLIAPSWDF